MELFLCERRSTISYRDGDIFRKYYKYASEKEVVDEINYSMMVKRKGIYCPNFVRYGYSKQKKMFYSEFEYIDFEYINVQDVEAVEQALDILKNMPLIHKDMKIDNLKLKSEINFVIKYLPQRDQNEYARLGNKIIQKKYNIEKENKLLGCIARFETFKGIIPTLRVLNGYQNLKWHLIIAGEGSQKNQIQNYLSNNFAKNKYTFLGKLNHEEALYTISSLDMLLNLSINYSRESGQDLYIHTETMGRSMLEAVCCGVPIVASDVGGISELFLENKWIGYMMSDFQQFTMLFPSILNNKAEVKLGDEDKYDWKYIFRIYLALMADNKKIIGIEEKLDE